MNRLVLPAVACILALIACGYAALDKKSGHDSKRCEFNKSLIRHYYEDVVNTGNVDAIAEYISPEDVYVQEGVKHHLGHEGEKEHLLSVHRTYPDLNLTVEGQIAEGDWVATVVTARGTH